MGVTEKRNYLQKGDSGDEVKQLQQNLIKLGYNCGSAGADGIFGDGTEKAVKTFQKNQNLTRTDWQEKRHRTRLKIFYGRKQLPSITSRREPTEQKKMQT